MKDKDGVTQERPDLYLQVCKNVGIEPHMTYAFFFDQGLQHGKILGLDKFMENLEADKEAFRKELNDILIKAGVKFEI